MQRIERLGAYSTTSNGGTSHFSDPGMGAPKSSSSWSRITLVVGSALGLAVGVRVWSALDLPPQTNTGIVSWITIHGYSKAAEQLAYWGAFPAAVVGALALARSIGQPVTAGFDATGPATARTWGVIVGAGLLILLVLSGSWAYGAAAGYMLIAAFVATGLSNGAPAAAAELQSRPATYLTLTCIAIYALLFSGERIHADVLDTYADGELLVAWQMFLDGRVPYRDIFINQGLGQNLGKAALAGWGAIPSLYTMRLVQNALEPLAYVALYLLGRRLFRFETTAVAVAFCTYGFRIGMLDRQIFPLLALWLLSVTFQSSRYPRAAAAGSGALVVLSLLYSSDTGMAVAAAATTALLLALVMAADRPSAAHNIGAFVGGATLVALPFLVWLVSEDALQAFLRNSVVQLTYSTTAWGIPFPPLVTPTDPLPVSTALRTMDGLVRAYIAPIVYVAVSVVVIDRWRCRLPMEKWLPRLLCLGYGIVLFQTALSRSDDPKILRGGYFCLLFLALAGEGVWIRYHRARLRPAARIASAVGVAALLITAHQVYRQPVRNLAAHAVRIVQGRSLGSPVEVQWRPLGGVDVSPGTIRPHREVAERINQLLPPGQSYFDFSNQPAFHVYTGRAPVVRYSVVAFAAGTPAQREVVADLRRERVPLVLAAGPTFFNRIDGIPQSRRHPLIAEYLESEYRTLGEWGDTTFLAHNDYAVDTSGRLVAVAVRRPTEQSDGEVARE